MRHYLCGGAMLVAAVWAAGAWAGDATIGQVSVKAAWARASAGNAPNGAAFLALENAGATDRLVAVSTPVAARAELHTHSNDGGVMRMRQIEAIALPAGGTVTLAPGGQHVMLIGLKQPLRQGEAFPLSLRFEKAGTTTVQVEIAGPGAMAPAAMHGGHGPMHGAAGAPKQ